MKSYKKLASENRAMRSALKTLVAMYAHANVSPANGNARPGFISCITPGIYDPTCPYWRAWIRARKLALPTP